MADPLQTSEDQVPTISEGPPEVTVTLRGRQVARVLQDLKDNLAGETTEKDIVLRALGVLHQAIGRRVTLTDGSGAASDLHGLWKSGT